MKRRTFVGQAGIALLAIAPGAAAQPARGIHRVGFLSHSQQPWDEGFRAGLHDLGYRTEDNLKIEYRYAEGKTERLLGLATDLVRIKVEVILSGGTQATIAARQSTATLPIVMAVTADPVGSGFVASLARPGGNITGLTSSSSELSGKRLALLKEIVPTLKRVGVLWNSTNRDNTTQLSEARSAATALDVELRPVDVGSANDLDRAFSTLVGWRPHALYTLGDSVFANGRRRIIEFATQNRLPSMFSTRETVDAGGLVAYGTSFFDLFRRAATYVDKILKGAKPGDLPIEQPTKFELAINVKTAKALGLTIPPSVLARADAIVQ